jgi:membrane-bound metal-dependent hydrolase YbcI (DUF457 family)
MFIGHYGVGFAAKKYAAAISLGWLFIAVQFSDLLWPTLLLFNVEHVAINHDPNMVVPLVFTDYSFSHSLLMVVVWSLLFAFIYWMIKKNSKYAFVLALCVFSHWLLDLVVHYPDLPLYPGNSPKVGLKLWSQPIVDDIVEMAIFVIGLVIYLRTTISKNNWGKYILWVLAVLLVGSFAANIFGPPPTDVKAIAWTAQFMWVFVILAFWVDHNRKPKNLPAIKPEKTST